MNKDVIQAEAQYIKRLVWAMRARAHCGAPDPNGDFGATVLDEIETAAIRIYEHTIAKEDPRAMPQT